MRKKKLCKFYLNVRDIDINNEGFEKTFTCDCNRHQGEKITVRVYQRTIREVRKAI